MSVRTMWVQSLGTSNIDSTYAEARSSQFLLMVMVSLGQSQVMTTYSMQCLLKIPVIDLGADPISISSADAHS